MARTKPTSTAAVLELALWFFATLDLDNFHGEDEAIAAANLGGAATVAVREVAGDVHCALNGQSMHVAPLHLQLAHLRLWQ